MMKMYFYDTLKEAQELPRLGWYAADTRDYECRHRAHPRDRPTRLSDGTWKRFPGRLRQRVAGIAGGLLEEDVLRARCGLPLDSDEAG